MTDESTAADLDTSCIDGESHDLNRVETIEWDTPYESLNERFETVVYDCDRDDCEYRLICRERRSSTLDEFSS